MDISRNELLNLRTRGKSGAVCLHVEKRRFRMAMLASPSNDMVFCLFDIDETPRTVGLSAHHGMLTGAYDVFHITGINSKYLLYYYLSLDNVKAMRPLYKGLRKTIGIDTFLGTKMPVPPRVEQDQLVRYLDWQVSKINRLIATKKQEIALFEESKINHMEARSGTVQMSTGARSGGAITSTRVIRSVQRLMLHRRSWRKRSLT